MPQPSTPRIEQLQRMLEKTPTDAFLLYAIALEHKKAGEAKQAIEFLNKTIVVDPAYCYAYHQLGLVQESLGDVEAAKTAYREGIAAARKAGDAHAAGEIEGALAAMSDE